MPNPPIVHFLRAGVTPCEMRGVPGDWPPGHAWSPEWAEVTCTQCLAAKETFRRVKAWLSGSPPPAPAAAEPAELALEIVAPEAGAACEACGKRIRLVNDAVWVGTLSLSDARLGHPTAGACVCGECLSAGQQLLHAARHGT
jgi:hypothetical protein